MSKPDDTQTWECPHCSQWNSTRNDKTCHRCGTPQTEIEKVTLTKVEGRADCCYENKEFSSIREANRQLRTDERPEMGYHKYDFVIKLRNGATYRGRFDLVPVDSDIIPDLAEHIRAHIRYHLVHGNYKPEEVEPAKTWVKMLEGE